MALKVDEARANIALQKILLAQAQESPTGEVRAAEEAVKAAEAALAGAEARLQQVQAGATASDLAAASAARAFRCSGPVRRRFRRSRSCSSILPPCLCPPLIGGIPSPDGVTDLLHHT
ncbi:MAG: hypothetical protein HY331_13645 [Chloroflexi bacterium]|nr:hypothetical protein [Chloroflexota bacterium]